MTPDQTLKCEDCGTDFLFTEKEQQFFQEKGFSNIPKRCQACRSKRRNQNNRRRPGGGGGGFGGGGGRMGGGGGRGGGGGGMRRGGGGGGPRGGGGGADRPKYTIVCNACGQEATVPFEPIPGRAIYCPNCYKDRKGMAQ